MVDNFRKLGDICNIDKLISFNINIIDESNHSNMYPVINAGKTQLGFCYEFNTPEHTILCSSIGNYAGFINKYDIDIYAKNCFTIKPINNMIDNNYLYHILKFYQENIYDIKTGIAIKSIEKELLENIIIPVPSLEIQLELVNKINNIDTFIRQLEDILTHKKKEVSSILSDMIDTLHYI